MAKQRNKRTNRRAAKQAPRRSQPKLRVPSGLDSDGLRYAKLLADPCGSELCHPLYAGTDGGVLARFEVDTLNFAGSTEANGAVVWTPGAIGTNGTTTNSLVYISNAASGAGTTCFNFNPASQPGFNYLSSTAKAVRCVAACLQVYWAGTESNRSGYITYGNCDGLAMATGGTYTVDGVSQLFTKSERMPTEYVEVKWKPMAGDQDWTDPTAANPGSDMIKRGAIGFAFKGIPVSTGLRIRYVAVYEFQPASNQGMSIPYNSRSKSVNTMDHVVNYLDSFGDWATSAGRLAGSGLRMAGQVGRAVRAVSYVATKIPAIMA